MDYSLAALLGPCMYSTKQLPMRPASSFKWWLMRLLVIVILIIQSWECKENLLVWTLSSPIGLNLIGTLIQIWVVANIKCFSKRWISPLQKIAEKFKALDLTGLEKIEAFVKAPWVPPVPVHIFDKEEAIQGARNLDPWKPVVFTDGSARNNAIGIGVKLAGSLAQYF